MRKRIFSVKRPWSVSDVATAAHIWQRDIMDYFGDDIPPHGAKRQALRQIAKALRRNLPAVATRYSQYGSSFNGRRSLDATGASRYIAPTVLAAREQRQTAAEQRDLTAVIMGDPPPGYSALDRRGR